MTQPTNKRLLTEAAAGEHAADPGTPLGAALSATIGHVTLPEPSGLDDTAAIQSVISGASGKSVRARPGANYIVAGDITVPSGASLEFLGATFTLKAGATPAFIFKAAGSVPGLNAPTATLTSNAATLAKTLTVASTAGITVGDVLILGDNTQVVQPSGQSTKYYGEQVMVKSVDSATQITLHGAVRGNYTTAASAGLHKVSFAENVILRGGTYVSPNKMTNSAGIISLTACRNFRVDNVTIVGGDGPGITVTNCRSGAITAPIISDLTDDPATSRYGYGINLGGATEGLTIMGGTVARVRHAVTTNAHTGHRGIPRDVTITGMYATQTTGASYDTHAGAEGIVFTGCISDTSLYGFQSRSTLTRILDCTVKYSTSHAVQIVESGGNNVEIDGLNVYRVGGHGVFVNGQVTDVTLKNSTFNHVGGDGYRSGDDNAHRATVKDNTFRNLGESLTGSRAVHFVDGKFSNGHIVGRNHFVKDSTWAGVGDYTVGVYLASGVTTSHVHDNGAIGLATVLSDLGPSNRKHGNIALDAKLNVFESAVTRIGQVDLGSQATTLTRSAVFDIGAVSTFSPSRLYEVSLASRNTTSGARGVARLAVTVYRDSGNAVSVGTTLENIQGSLFALATGGTLNVTTSVATDGSTLTILAENTSANTQNIIVGLRGR